MPQSWDEVIGLKVGPLYAVTALVYGRSFVTLYLCFPVGIATLGYIA